MFHCDYRQMKWWCFCFITGLAIAGLYALNVSAEPAPLPAAKLRPNVILVMTDDQGYGDLGAHENQYLKTPAIDKLYRESLRLTDFHVDPTCSPTRAALMTGRYSCRTGVWHTIMGRSIPRADEVTIADLMAKAGYRTAIFGKWHLGDAWPYRAMDRGFQESLVHGGGGIGQTPDFWGNTYFDPVLCHNGQWKPFEGYCTDIFFREAIRFVEENRKRPFFLYLPTNVPHSPYQVPEEYRQRYLSAGVEGALANFYGMIHNFDENLGRLLDRVDQLGLGENTVVIFLTDNGTSGSGFNVNMRGRKGSQYDGGHRVPCFIRWPARLKGGRDIDHITAHIDLLPTILDFCNVPYPREIEPDGKSLIPLLVGVEDWYQRTLFVQSHRMENPIKWRQSAVMTDQYRLVDGTQLFDMEADPQQRYNIAGRKPEIYKEMRQAYELWWKDVSKRFDEYCRIPLGAAEANPTRLTCHDWHGSRVPWHQSHISRRLPANGKWAVTVARPGRYRFTLRERPAVAKFPLPAEAARVQVAGQAAAVRVPEGATAVPVELDLPEGHAMLETTFIEDGRPQRGAYFVEVEYLGPAVEKPATPDRPSDAEPTPQGKRTGRSAY